MGPGEVFSGGQVACPQMVFLVFELTLFGQGVLASGGAQEGPGVGGNIVVTPPAGTYTSVQTLTIT